MYARTMAMLRGCEVWVCVSWWVRVRESGAARAWGFGRRWADGDYACKGLRAKWRRCGVAPAVKWVNVRGGWAERCADVGSLSYKIWGSVSKSNSKEAQMWGRGRVRAVGCSVWARKEMGEEARE